MKIYRGSKQCQCDKYFFFFPSRRGEGGRGRYGDFVFGFLNDEEMSGVRKVWEKKVVSA